jgi:hypothetical protein
MPNDKSSMTNFQFRLSALVAACRAAPLRLCIDSSVPIPEINLPVRQSFCGERCLFPFFGASPLSLILPAGLASRRLKVSQTDATEHTTGTIYTNTFKSMTCKHSMLHVVKAGQTKSNRLRGFDGSHKSTQMSAVWFQSKERPLKPMDNYPMTFLIDQPSIPRIE